MTIILAILFGGLIGLLLGLVGGGGSILTVPILVYAIGQGVHEATATSLVIVGATALFGGVAHARAGRVALRTAMTFGGAGIAGAFVGAWFNARLSGPLILFLFGFLMLGVALRMAFTSTRRREDADGTEARGVRWQVLIAGLIVGVMTGFFGVGGGFLIVPALVVVLGMPMPRAVGTSLLIIAINAGAGILAHLETGGIDLRIALIFVIGGVTGATLGSHLAGHMDETKLSRGFAALVAIVGLYLIARNSVVLV